MWTTSVNVNLLKFFSKNEESENDNNPNIAVKIVKNPTGIENNLIGMHNINETENENSYQTHNSNKDEEFKTEENKNVISDLKKDKKG